MLQRTTSSLTYEGEMPEWLKNSFQRHGLRALNLPSRSHRGSTKRAARSAWEGLARKEKVLMPTRFPAVRPTEDFCFRE